MPLNRGIGAVHGTTALRDDDINRGFSSYNFGPQPVQREAPGQVRATEVGVMDRNVDNDDAIRITRDEEARNTHIESSSPFTEKNVEGALRELNTNVGSDVASLEADVALLQTETEANAIRNANIVVTDTDTDVEVADGTIPFTIPPALNGMQLNADTTASVSTKGITGQMDIQIRRRRAGVNADMLSTKLILGDVFFTSNGVVNANGTVQTGDQLFIDVDVIHTTPAKGLSVVIVFE